MANLSEDGQQNEKQKAHGGDFLGRARESASGTAEKAQESKQAHRLEEEEEEAKTQQRAQDLEVNGVEGGRGGLNLSCQVKERRNDLICHHR